MKIKTKISKLTDDDTIIRSTTLSQLIEKGSFADAIFVLLRNKSPTEVESKLFSAMLTSIVDHGAGTTSSLVTRFTASTGNQLNAAVGTGVVSLSDYHGGAIEKAMGQLSCFATDTTLKQTITSMLDQKKIIYGYGHKVYKTHDPRVNQLVKKMKELNYTSRIVDCALEIETLIENIKGTKICLNIDGMLAALLLEMGFDPKLGKGIFIIGRVPSLIAQCVEEQSEKPVRRLDEKDIIFNSD